MCDALTAYFLEALGITTPLAKSSLLGVTGVKDELILNLCRHAGASTYLSGALGVQYLQASRFSDAAIALSFQSYAHPTYTQMYSPFVPGLSVLDLLMCAGSAARQILLAGQAEVQS